MYLVYIRNFKHLAGLGNWRECTIRNCTVWPYLFLLNVFTALKGTHFYILFVLTAAGVMLCGSPKKKPRTSSIVQFIFFFWSFEIRVEIFWEIIFFHRFRPLYSKQVFAIRTPFGFISVFWLAALSKLELTETRRFVSYLKEYNVGRVSGISCEKTGFLHMQKQRRRLVSAFVFATCVV